jgi:hypothetical protein
MILKIGLRDLHGTRRCPAGIGPSRNRLEVTNSLIRNSVTASCNSIKKFYGSGRTGDLGSGGLGPF